MTHRHRIGAALAFAALAGAAQAQTTAEEIEAALAGSAGAERINRIIMMEVPRAEGGTSRVALDAARSVDLAVFFAFDSAEVTPEAEALLAELARALAAPALAAERFLVAGHTDARGGAAYNLALSERRAASVRAHLVARHGIDPERLLSVGLGETRPADSTDPTNAVNRRVEITLIAG